VKYKYDLELLVFEKKIIQLSLYNKLKYMAFLVLSRDLGTNWFW